MYVEPAEPPLATIKNSGITSAASAARGADAAIVFLTSDSGEGYMTVEGHAGDRNHLDLWPSGNQLVQAVAVKAVVWAGLPSQESGNALVDVLYGANSPSGKLPYTIAKAAGDYGTSVSRGGSDSFSEGLYIDYRHFDRANIAPRYEFSFGFSYTNFTYSAIAVEGAPKSGPATGAIVSGGRADLFETVATVTVNVPNSGSVAGAEVAQLYVDYPSSVTAPLKQLRRFEKLPLEAGASRTATFELRRRDLSYWDVARQNWVVPTGAFTISVGASSRDIRQTATLTVSGDGLAGSRLSPVSSSVQNHLGIVIQIVLNPPPFCLAVFSFLQLGALSFAFGHENWLDQSCEKRVLAEGAIPTSKIPADKGWPCWNLFGDLNNVIVHWADWSLDCGHLSNYLASHQVDTDHLPALLVFRPGIPLHLSQDLLLPLELPGALLGVDYMLPPLPAMTLVTSKSAASSLTVVRRAFWFWKEPSPSLTQITLPQCRQFGAATSRGCLAATQLHFLEASLFSSGLDVYYASKTKGEQVAWAWVQEHARRFVFNTLLPDTNFGSVLDARHQGHHGTHAWIKALYDRGVRAVPPEIGNQPPQSFVNIQDDAVLQVAALIYDDVRNERLFAFAHHYNFDDILAVLRKVCPPSHRLAAGFPGQGRNLTTVPNARARALVVRMTGRGWTSLEDTVRQAIQGYI
ncbi:beta-glucosidase 1 [Apiospora phragmitis]|uniref:beta-glucosidase n=1 Tax=Apiospora phragmitis TaxID=2905665 RepID=A0ABR1V036_9PEZI